MTPESPSFSRDSGNRESSWAAAARSVLRRPAFLAAAGLLLLAAIGLNAATQALQLYFKKLPVPLTRPLATIPPRLGHWVQVTRDQPLPHDVEETLAAVEYVFRDYVDVDALRTLDVDIHRDADAGHPAVDVAYHDPTFAAKTLDGKVASLEKLLANRSAEDRRLILSDLQARTPTAVLNCAVTYYTGLVDTVAHIPDRCYIAGGFQPREYDTPTWTTGTNPDGTPAELPVRFINFEDRDAGTTLPTRSVAYTFYVNGHAESDPLAVRARLQRLTEKYGYYAKIELMTMVKDRPTSAAMMTDFLTAARPEIERCLPDWRRVQQQGVTVATATK